MNVLNPPRAAILSSYRSCLRQIRLLPTEYLRQFFRIKVADDVRAVLKRDDVKSRNMAAKRISNTMRTLQRANDGHPNPFARILDLAYGRTGKLRWELNEPLLTDPNAPKLPRIIPNDEKSSPPVYPAPLQALLFNSKARINGKSLTPRKLMYPTGYPRHGLPGTEEAKLLGPLSKRRQKNILWRAFAMETGKIYPPLQLVVSERQPKAKETSNPASLSERGVQSLGFQGQGLYEELEQIASFAPMALTRREQKVLGLSAQQPVPRLTPHSRSHLTGRFIRRRFRQLLDRIPVLKYSYPVRNDSKPGSYSVRFSPHLLSPHKRFAGVISEFAEPEDLEWVEHAQSQRSL